MLVAFLCQRQIVLLSCHKPLALVGQVIFIIGFSDSYYGIGADPGRFFYIDIETGFPEGA